MSERKKELRRRRQRREQTLKARKREGIKAGKKAS
jgi:hypothetical protein